MVETYDIRLFSKFLSIIAGEDHISRTPRRVAAIMRGIVGDPQFVRIGELGQQLRKSGLGHAFAGWEIQRSYDEEELDRAELGVVSSCGGLG